MEKNSTGRCSTTATFAAAPSAKAGLAHAGTGRDDDEVRGLQAEQDVVELGVAGGDAGEGVLAAVQLLELIEGQRERVTDLHLGVGDPALGDLEDERLGAVDVWPTSSGAEYASLGISPGTTIRRRSRASSATIDAYWPALADDGVAACSCSRVGFASQGVGSRLLRRSSSASVIGVDGLTLAVELDDGVVDVAVRRLVEVGRLDLDLDRVDDRVARQEHRAEQRLLRLDVVGRDAPRSRRRRGGLNRLDHSYPSNDDRTTIVASMDCG